LVAVRNSSERRVYSAAAGKIRPGIGLRQSSIGHSPTKKEITIHDKPVAAYSPSKAALHAISLAFAIENTNIKVNVACPGYVATDLNNFRGTRTVEQGAREAVRLALLDAKGPRGTFSNEYGSLPW
jgi:NAD(P)-dependent dehydrogenase (short-subunit alcohol dehydrogenase family)